MATFNAYLRKEMIESSRQYRYLVLAIGIILFAILDPLMLKLLPIIMKNQIPVDLSSLMVITPKSAMLNYIKDLYQIGSIFVVFTIGGALSDEIRSERLVFPYSLGCKPAELVLAKAVHYCISIAILIFAGFLMNFYYGGVLFSGESVGLAGAMASAVLMSLYFVFLIIMTLLISSLVKKGITAGFISLAASYITLPFADMDGIGSFMPYKLVQGANAFSIDGMTCTIIFILLLSAVFAALTICRMEKVEVI